MATIQQKAQTVVWYADSKSVTVVQRQFRLQYQKNPPDGKSIKRWFFTFLTTGTVKKRHGGGRRVTNEQVEEVRADFTRNPRRSIRIASRELQIPRTTLHRILHKRLHLSPYKIQMVQQLLPDDKPRRLEFATDIMRRIEEDPDFLSRVMFSDEATFHVCGKVNRHNIRIWGTENPHIIEEYIRDSPKVNVWCGLMKDMIIGPFIFMENTVTSTTYLDMLEQYVFPQIAYKQPNIFFQQDGAPPHWSNIVRTALNSTFPGRWIGRGGPIAWPPRSPDITPLDFYLWGYVKDIVYKARVHDVNDLRALRSEFD